MTILCFIGVIANIDIIGITCVIAVIGVIGVIGVINVIGVIGVDESGRIVSDWNAEGPVYGSNGEFELDPDNTLCVIIISGMMMAMEECVGPLCVAASGQCCLLTMGTRGIECPPSC